VHGGAAGESQGGCGVEIDPLRKADKGASGDEDFFGETAVAIDAEELAEEAQRFIAMSAEFAFTAKEVGLDGDFIAGMPFLDVAAQRQYAACDFAAERARQLDGNGQASRFGPKIDVVQAAALDLHDGVIWTGYGIRDIAQFEFSGCAMSDELESLQTRPKSKVQSPKSRE
jgi:hypothetical protein